MPRLRLQLLATAGLAALLLAAPRAAAPGAPPAAESHAGKDGLSPTVAALLDQIRQNDRGLLAVSREDGRFLRMLVASSGAKRVLEIGGASGYSAIWMGLGLRETGGTMVTIEYDPVRAKELTANVAKAGLSDIVTAVSGDAFARIPELKGDFDFVFLDAWKKDYKRFFDMVSPRLTPGGLFLAHNVVNKKSEMGDFLAAIEQSSLFTTIVSPSGEGISVSYKRRK